MAPQPQANAGVFTMSVKDGRVWQYVVNDAKAAAKAIDEVLYLKTAAGKERASGLLKWVERHRLEFGGGFHDDGRIGWGSLEMDVFDWICDQGRPEEVWSAVGLYAELNHGAVLPLKGPYFATESARDFLFQIALNERMLDGARARALTLLADARTLNPAADPSNRAVVPCSDADLVLLIQKLSLLIEGNSPRVRNSATAALHSIYTSRGTAAPVQMELKNALAAVERAYKAEQPGVERDRLVELIHAVGGPERWKEVSGNKTGVAVLLRDFGRSNDQVYFWLQVLPRTEKFYERPTLVLEYLGPNQVLETKTLPLPMANPPRWEDGWTPDDLLLVQFPATAMTPKTGTGPRSEKSMDYVPSPSNGGPAGRWRVSVRGTVGKEKVAWASEPKLLVVRHQPNPNEGINYSGDK
jgi:hypothetical protein